MKPIGLVEATGGHGEPPLPERIVLRSILPIFYLVLLLPLLLYFILTIFTRAYKWIVRFLLALSMFASN